MKILDGCRLQQTIVGEFPDIEIVVTIHIPTKTPSVRNSTIYMLVDYIWLGNSWSCRMGQRYGELDERDAMFYISIFKVVHLYFKKVVLKSKNI